MEDFYIICQLAITTAGFAALASLIKPKSKEMDSAFTLNLVRFYIMIELAVTVTAFGFLPAVLNGFFDDEINFRISSGLMFISAILMYNYNMNRNKRISGKINIGGLHTKIMRLITFIGILIVLLNALGFLKPFYKEAYLASLYIIFLISLNIFYRLIVNAIK